MKRGISALAALLGKRELPRGGRETAAKQDRAAAQAEPEEDLIRFWEGEAPSCRITLTDVQAVDRSWRHTLDDSLLVGFSQEMDICVNYDKSVSRRHCELCREGDLFSIINHSRSNGTYLNHRAVTEKTPISDGDVITMGRVELRLEIDG